MELYCCGASRGASELNVLYLTLDPTLFFGAWVGNNGCVFKQQFCIENFTVQGLGPRGSPALIRGVMPLECGAGALVMTKLHLLPQCSPGSLSWSPFTNNSSIFYL